MMHFIRARSGWIQKENGSMHMAVLIIYIDGTYYWYG